MIPSLDTGCRVAALRSIQLRSCNTPDTEVAGNGKSCNTLQHRNMYSAYISHLQSSACNTRGNTLQQFKKSRVAGHVFLETPCNATLIGAWHDKPIENFHEKFNANARRSRT